jgi:hypothetical protein
MFTAAYALRAKAGKPGVAASPIWDTTCDECESKRYYQYVNKFAVVTCMTVMEYVMNETIRFAPPSSVPPINLAVWE